MNELVTHLQLQALDSELRIQYLVWNFSYYRQSSGVWTFFKDLRHLSCWLLFSQQIRSYWIHRYI